MAAERKHLFDRPGNVQRLLYVLYACCALLFAVEFLDSGLVKVLEDGIPVRPLLGID